MAVIELNGVGKAFQGSPVIRDVSLRVEDGEFCVFVGPSGCGKSTLLRLIAGLEAVTTGRIMIGGRDVTALEPYARGLSMVFQNYALYPHMTVRDNIAFSLRTARLPEKQVAAKVAEAARMLQLDAYLDRKPAALSGGQRQRVAIGRAIVRQPQAFLFDEPLSNLDAALRSETRVEIARLHRQLGATMIYVTHDQIEAMTLADRIVVLRAGQIMQVGTPRDLYERPANLFVAQFIGSPRMNLIPGGAIGEAAAQIGVRPEHMRPVQSGSGRITGRVDFTEYLGADASVIVDCGAAGRLSVRMSGQALPTEGSVIDLDWDPELAHRFDTQGLRLPLVTR